MAPRELIGDPGNKLSLDESLGSLSKARFLAFVHSLIDWEQEVEYGGCFGKDWVSCRSWFVDQYHHAEGGGVLAFPSFGSAGLSTIDMVNLCAAGSVKHVLLEKEKISQYVFSNENGESGAPGLVLARASAKAAKKYARVGPSTRFPGSRSSQSSG